MKTPILAVALVGLLTNPSFANNAIQLLNKGNDGGTVYQIVNIINPNINVAAFNVYSGIHATDVIADYNNGLIVYHVPSKRTCVVSRMNRQTFPSLSQLDNMIRRGQPLHSLHRSYQISRTLIRNIASLGGPIQAICGGLNTYWATES